MITRLRERRQHFDHVAPVRDELHRGGAGSGELALQNLRTSLPLHLADSLALALASCLTIGISHWFQIGPAIDGGRLLLGTWAGTSIAYLLVGLYPGVGLTATSEFRLTSVASTIVCLGIATAGIIRSVDGMLIVVGIFWVVTLVSIPACRSIARSCCAAREWWTQPVLIIGDRDSNRIILDGIRNDSRSGLRPVGVIYDSDDAVVPESEPPSFRSANSIAELANLRRELSVNRAIVTSDSPYLADVQNPGVDIPHIHVVTNLAHTPTLWTDAGERAGLAEIQFKNRLHLPAERWMKRCIDLAVIVVASPILAPLFCFLVALVKLTSQGPVFYSHQRLGLYGRHFAIWKFRTMVANADQVLEQCLESDSELKTEWDRTQKLKHDPRITFAGAFLRKTSLDELPQLWNVIAGQMSLVGPRPIIDSEVAKYGDVYQLYKQVLPGITGLWQISGRNNTSYDTRLELDEYYVRNWSPWFDAYILLHTVKTVLLREGAY